MPGLNCAIVVADARAGSSILVRFIHTADWQLGLKLRYLQPERAAQLRLLRFQTVRAIAEAAKSRQVDFVLVAGDVLDDNGLGPDTLQQTADALRSFGDIPVGLLPGNHDAATADCALLRLELPQTIQVLTRREPVRFGEVLVYPCPLLRRHEMDDPTGWLPAREPGEGLRIAVAHGGVIDFADGVDSETPNLIDARAVLAKGFDYLALGDWHGTFRFDSRVWYPGAPEATRFKEADPGAILVVEIDAAGSEPRVERVPVARTRWLTLELELVEDSQVARLRERLDGLEERSQTLLNLSLRGAVSLAARDGLDALLSDYGARLVYLRQDLSGLQTHASDSDLARLSAEGFMSDALARLRESGDESALDAVRLLFRLHREATDATA
jgi:DNA repair exonuclease SbcCD nuclease subunit